MIIKIGKNGKSFTGLATYLCTDPKAKTADRVAWTHTLNCAEDHVPSAVNEMLWTFRDAELLKQEAGVRPGGRRVDSPVKSMSLNWAPSDPEISREEQIATAEEFLKFMGWQEHQALLVAHDDKEHRHVHIMLNRIHPETGRACEDAKEWRRAQAFALEYERSHGMIHCEERLKPVEEREPSPPREAALILKGIDNEYEKSNTMGRNIASNFLVDREPHPPSKADEWKILKEHQRHEREAYFADGRSEFIDLRKEIYREVREEFREQWADYYVAKRNGQDTVALSAMRAEILDAQRTTLTERRDAACSDLRESRDATYRELLDSQQDTRASLTFRHEQDLHGLTDLIQERGEPNPFTRTADEARGESRQMREHVSREELDGFEFEWPSAAPTTVRPGLDIAGNLGMGMLGSLGAVGESLFDGFFGAPTQPKQPEPPRTPPPRQEFPKHNPFAHFAEEMQQQAARRQEESDRTWWDERYARHRD